MGSLSKYEVDPFDAFEEEYDTLLITENADIKNTVVGRVIVKGSSCTVNIGEGADIGNIPRR